MRWALPLLGTWAFACSPQPIQLPPDAAPSDGALPEAGAPDATADHPAVLGDGGHCAESDAGPTGAHVVYLAFDGVHLVHDDRQNDAPSGRTYLVPNDVDVPPFLDGAGSRDAIIAGVKARIAAALADYDIVFTRVRPPAGPYLMVVFGGSAVAIIGMPSFSGFGPLDCGNGNPSDLMLVFDAADGTLVANSALFTLGLASGLSATTLLGDCASSTTSSNPCTFGQAAPVDPSAACDGAPAVQDELAELAGAFGCL